MVHSVKEKLAEAQNCLVWFGVKVTAIHCCCHGFFQLAFTVRQH